ncbi:Glucan 1,3-beta-glucosidase [Globisporangium polare]
MHPQRHDRVQQRRGGRHANPMAVALGNGYWEHHLGTDDPGPHCIVPDGMERFVDRLAEPIAECIQMNTLVKSIAHQGAAADSREGVVIECDDGRMIKADFVIVTSALGLLKAGELSFTPALPQETQQAIQRSQMGQYLKVLVQFPDVFWQRDARFIGQLVTPTASGDIAFPLLFNSYFAKQVPVLEGVLIGDTAMCASKLSAEEVVAAFFKQPQRTFGIEIPSPPSSPGKVSA